MNMELEALEGNDTWEITTFPPNKKAIRSKWLFKTKFKADGSIERYKARLVILGCKKVYGIDYENTFAPLAKTATIRALLVVATLNKWIVVQIDVMNTILHGDLEETVFMKLPLGYTYLGCRIFKGDSLSIVNKTPVIVCKLKKSLYGLKQTPITGSPSCPPL